MVLHLSKDIENRISETFRQAIRQRLASLGAGDSVDGGDTMARLIAEIE